MKPIKRWLLAFDALINLLLGAGLMLAPAGLLGFLGLPPSATDFYPTILGGVLFGIGVGLLLELWGVPRGIRGLGLGGAIAINLSGAGVLLFWLLRGDLDLPLRGRIVLWIVAVVVLGVGVAEIATRSWRYEG